MAKRCKHDFTRLRFRDGSERQGLAMELEHGVVRDVSCPAIPFRIDFLHSVKCDDCGEQLALGDSDEEPARVSEGIRAAGKLAALVEAAIDVAPNGAAECDVWADDESFTFSGGPHADEFNDSLWDWDVTRPIAGQYEERQGFAFAFSEMERTGAGYPPANLIDEDDDAPPPADPALQAAAARYLESDEGKAHAAERADTSPADAAWQDYAAENFKPVEEFEAGRADDNNPPTPFDFSDAEEGSNL